MKSSKISDAMNHIDDDLISGAELYCPKKRSRTWITWIATAACLCLVLYGAVDTLLRLEYLSFAGCSGANPGTIVNGDYYYHVDHEGLYRFSDGTSELVLHTYWYHSWSVNDYGIYYGRGKSIYVLPHDSSKATKLYTASINPAYFSFDLQPNGSIAVTLRDKKTSTIHQILLDGITGEVLTTLTKPFSPADEADFYSRKYSVGNRQITWTFPEGSNNARLIEQGRELLPENLFAQTTTSFYSGDVLILYGREWPWQNGQRREEIPLIVLRPDGNDTILSVPNTYYSACTSDYLLYSDYNSAVYCLDLSTGESWQLTLHGTSQVSMYHLVSDGSCLYTCSPMKEVHEYWKLEYENKKPVGLSLLQSDITQ